MWSLWGNGKGIGRRNGGDGVPWGHCGDGGGSHYDILHLRKGAFQLLFEFLIALEYAQAAIPTCLLQLARLE